VAHSRGFIDYDQRVASYWPAFAASGKDEVTVRQLLSHQAGLPAITPSLELRDLGDVERMSEVLASEPPAWEPGTRHGYHGITLGWYESELLRHADPRHRTLGRFFAEEVAAPLGLDFHVGLPDEIPDERRATIHGYKPAEMILHLHQMPPRFVAGFLNPRSITFKTFGNPRILGLVNEYNRRDVLRIEIPAANGTGTVRSIAAAYGEFATDGRTLGLAPATVDALKHPATPPTGGLFDVVLRTDTIFSLGYVKPFPRFRFGSRAGLAFGTPGAGGSFGFADPDTGIGFAYAMNRTGFKLWDDPRELALRQALHVAIGSDPQLPDA
jgi:CubicO group peptidase (beta-lactamase class C family)